MSSPVIQVENLSKYYRLGLIGGGTLNEDINRWLAKLRGKPDPLLKVGEEDNGNRKDGQIWALKDVNLEVNEGEILGIIGRNGAGKSTLLKILSKITAPTEGRIKIRGRVGSLLEVGTGFHPELTGRENIFLNGTILGMTHAEVSSKLEEIVEFAEMGKFIDTPVKRYSSGMRVRLAFAVAAHLEPEILIVDEVLAVGDAEFQKRCLGKMKDVAGHGRTVLFVSHNMGMINTLCDNAVLMSKGRVIFRGNTEAAIEKYLLYQETSNQGQSSAMYTVDKEVLLRGQKFTGIQIKEVTLCGVKNSANVIRTGDPLIIKIRYSSDNNFSSPAFVVSIKSYVGQELVRLSTMPISGYEITQTFRDGEVILTINDLPFVAGRYFLDIGLARERVEWLVKLENVVRFDVQLKDVYKSGFPLDSSKGLLIVGHQWAHQKYS